MLLIRAQLQGRPSLAIVDEGLEAKDLQRTRKLLQCHFRWLWDKDYGHRKPTLLLASRNGKVRPEVAPISNIVQSGPCNHGWQCKICKRLPTSSVVECERTMRIQRDKGEPDIKAKVLSEKRTVSLREDLQDLVFPILDIGACSLSPRTSLTWSNQ